MANIVRCDQVGKNVGGSLYVHVEAISGLEGAYQDALGKAENLSEIERDVDFNVVRFELAANQVALLNYPYFFDTPFPALQDSWKTDLTIGTSTYRTYVTSLNPPILHRKELLLSPENPHRQVFAALTREAESIGLFDEVSRIGYRRQWENLVRGKGYRIAGHQLIPIGNDDLDQAGTEVNSSVADLGWEASRHLTALKRQSLSAPVQTLFRYRFFDKGFALFDYGCGHGGDVQGLIENDVTASGWDPYYAQENSISAADIVNLGFVINVIEDFDERVTALTNAWKLADGLLVVSVMLSNLNKNTGRHFRDGVISSRNTFQKYYSQSEIKVFVGQVLDEEPITVAPGVLYVFKDKELEQQFLFNRYSRGHGAPGISSGTRCLEVARSGQDRHKAL